MFICQQFNMPWSGINKKNEILMRLSYRVATVTKLYARVTLNLEYKKLMSWKQTLMIMFLGHDLFSKITFITANYFLVLNTK